MIFVYVKTVYLGLDYLGEFIPPIKDDMPVFKSDLDRQSSREKTNTQPGPHHHPSRIQKLTTAK